MLNTIIIQPPLVQLNTPYPSGAYLLSFFNDLYKKQKIDGKVEWFDLSIELFHKIFCKDGLNFIFNKCYGKALKLADSFEKAGDDNSAFQIRRYICQRKNWIEWIDIIISIVCKSKEFSGREFVHEFVRSAHVSRGNRMEKYLSSLGRDVGVDDSQILASLALADLADFITMVYDKDFALIRYAERLAISTAKFEDIIDGLESPILNDFYKPILLEKIEKYKGEKNLFCVSIPFPGTFESAVFTGRQIKAFLGENSLVSFGGGYVNTELRNVKEKRLFEYCDFLSYDKGYGSYIDFFENDLKLDGKEFYKIKYLFKNEFVYSNKKDEKYEKKEKEIVHLLIPDFSSINFNLYPRLADDTNPMHRIWNDGAWIKAYMAYGCYWHRCAFCDTSLDYVNGFCNTNINSFYDGIYEQVKKAGVYGIHFVDEACPPLSMQQFALNNCVNKKGSGKERLTWWGNIRFEKTFTRDLADLLSYGGLTAVSGGIEIATGTGLDSVNKGTSIENIISACCAFKEAGILVHSYMIFGFWNQTEQDLINSMETLRQMFKNGLLDSAFWHKFSLTLHSTVFREWKEGKNKDLKPIINKNQFAENSLNFEGEQQSEKYSVALNYALELWMHGEKINKNVESFFDFKMPHPSISNDYVEKLIENYEKNKNNQFKKITKSCERFVWIGGEVIVLKSINKLMEQLCWSYMGELLYADVEKKSSIYKAEFINKISAENYDINDIEFSAEEIFKILGKDLFLLLRGKGLCLI